MMNQTPEIPAFMRAWQILHLGLITRDNPGIQLQTVPTPVPKSNEVLIKVAACGVCHTEVDEIEGRAPPSNMPMIPGHQVIGTVIEQGNTCIRNLAGKTVGVAWIFSACGLCQFCRQGLENLCSDFLACGRDQPGGYAEYMTAPEAFIHEVPASINTFQAAPLLCAGAVGYRSLRLAALVNGEHLGLTGFGASGHLVLQMARFLYPKSRVYVFARSAKEREYALELGAYWSGDTCEAPPVLLNAIIDTTPAWLPVLSALAVLAPAGRLVINAIRKEPGDHEIMTDLDYTKHLWREKSIRSVANVTREDIQDLLSLATQIPLVPRITQYSMKQADKALMAIKSGHIKGAGVLRIDTD